MGPLTRRPKDGTRGSAPPTSPPPGPPHFVGLALVFYTLVLAVAIGWAWLAGLSLVYADGAAAARGIHPFWDPASGLLAAALAIGLSRLLTGLAPWGERAARMLAALIGRRSWRDCLVLAAISGVAEEAFFRGALQPQVGLVTASALFGLAHFTPRRTLWPWMVFAVAAGFLLGGLFALTGNLVAPIVAHAAINAVNLRWLGQRYGS